MATRSIVPRANGEGGLGTSEKKWGSVYAEDATFSGTVTLVTPEAADNSTKPATTAFVKNQVASDTVAGMVELATPAEVKQGTDNERAVTPAGFKAAFGEFCPTGLTPTYVDANNFSVTGDQTAIFTQGRVLKITDTGGEGTVYAVVSASVYDTVTTVTIAGDTIDSGISAVLYAVQQHTSAIWESGSNANGEYVKFADGTMICNKVFLSSSIAISTSWGALYVSGNIGLGDWAATFIATPVVSYSCNSNTYFLILPTATQTVTGVGVVKLARSVVSTTLQRSFNIIGIGRWF